MHSGTGGGARGGAGLLRALASLLYPHKDPELTTCAVRLVGKLCQVGGVGEGGGGEGWGGVGEGRGRGGEGRGGEGRGGEGWGGEGRAYREHTECILLILFRTCQCLFMLVLVRKPLQLETHLWPVCVLVPPPVSWSCLYWTSLREPLGPSLA